MADFISEEFERRIVSVVGDEYLARRLVDLHHRYEFIIGILYTDEVNDYFDDKEDFENFINKHGLERAINSRFFDDYELAVIFQSELDVSEKILDDFFDCEISYLEEIGWVQPD